jgi:hypothetical protein
VSGYLIPEQDVSGFAQRLRELLVDTEKAYQFGLAGQTKEREQFGYERYIRELDGILTG